MFAVWELKLKTVGLPLFLNSILLGYLPSIVKLNMTMKKRRGFPSKVTNRHLSEKKSYVLCAKKKKRLSLQI